MARPRVPLLLAITAALVASPPAASAGGGGACHGASTESIGSAVELEQNCFGPTVLRVHPGQEVLWKNADFIEHTVTAAGGVFDATLRAGESFTYRFAEAGVYPYYCLLHPRMAGAVVVGDSVVSEIAADATRPVADLGPVEDGTSPTSAAAAAALIAGPLSFAAGRILRGRPRTS